MKTTLALGAALALLSAPAFAQYGGGAQNAGGPLGSAARSAGVDYGYGGYYGNPYGAYYGSYGPPAYSWGGPVYYGAPGYYGGPVYYGGPASIRTSTGSGIVILPRSLRRDNARPARRVQTVPLTPPLGRAGPRSWGLL